MNKLISSFFNRNFPKLSSSALSIDFKFIAAALQPLGEAISAQDNIPSDQRPLTAPDGAGRLLARFWSLRSTSRCIILFQALSSNIGPKSTFSAADDEKASGDSERNSLKKPVFFRVFFKCAVIWLVLRVKKLLFGINSVGGFGTKYRVFRNGGFGGFGTEVIKLSGDSERIIGRFRTNYRDFRNAYSIFK